MSTVQCSAARWLHSTPPPYQSQNCSPLQAARTSHACGTSWTKARRHQRKARPRARRAHARGSSRQRRNCSITAGRGAPWNALDRKGRCAGEFAVDAQSQECVDLLVNAGVRAQLLFGILDGSASTEDRSARVPNHKSAVQGRGHARRRERRRGHDGAGNTPHGGARRRLRRGVSPRCL